MSDTVKGFVVTLSGDIGTEKAKQIMNAIKMIEGVIDVSTSIRDVDDLMNRARIKYDLQQRFHDFYMDLLQR